MDVRSSETVEGMSWSDYKMKNIDIAQDLTQAKG